MCTKGFYQKCSTGPKASTRDDQWKCEKCTNLHQNRITESTNCQLPGPTNSLYLLPLPANFRNKLKIYQWNADGIRPKFVELRDRLINSDIAVLAVQESKLRKTRSVSRSYLSQLLPQSSRSPSLALQMSCYNHHTTRSVWEPPRVLRVACHSTWGCGSVRKEDLGQPWRLT